MSTSARSSAPPLCSEAASVIERRRRLAQLSALQQRRGQRRHAVGGRAPVVPPREPTCQTSDAYARRRRGVPTAVARPRSSTVAGAPRHHHQPATRERFVVRLRRRPPARRPHRSSGVRQRPRHDANLARWSGAGSQTDREDLWLSPHSGRSPDDGGRPRWSGGRRPRASRSAADRGAGCARAALLHRRPAATDGVAAHRFPSSSSRRQPPRPRPSSMSSTVRCGSSARTAGRSIDAASGTTPFSRAIRAISRVAVRMPAPRTPHSATAHGSSRAGSASSSAIASIAARGMCSSAYTDGGPNRSPCRPRCRPRRIQPRDRAR